MDKILRGRYLVRKSKLEDETEVLILTGVFHPQNFSTDEIKDNDEMWVSDIIVSGGLKFSDPIEKDGGSPEEFLEGKNQLAECWNTKGKL